MRLGKYHTLRPGSSPCFCVGEEPGYEATETLHGKYNEVCCSQVMMYLHIELAYEYLLQLVIHLTMLFIHSIFCEELLS